MLRATTVADSHGQRRRPPPTAERSGSLRDRELRFDRDAIDQARKLKAAHTPDNGWVTLIVGQDVADTIAADHVTAALKRELARAERAEAAAERERCAVFNEQRGVAIVDTVSRVKVDERTVKILTSINVASSLTASRCAVPATAIHSPQAVRGASTPRCPRRMTPCSGYQFGRL